MAHGFKNVYNPIIHRAVWEKVEQKRGKIYKRKTHDSEKNMFSGSLVCVDCTHNLHNYFIKTTVASSISTAPTAKAIVEPVPTSTYCIRIDFLEQIVLVEIKRPPQFASKYERGFVQAVIDGSEVAIKEERKRKQRELQRLIHRDGKLDQLFESLYEDNMSRKISNEWFARMSKRYEDKQDKLFVVMKGGKAEPETSSAQTMTTDMLAFVMKKYA